MSDCSEHYSETGFWEKVRQATGLSELLELALKLYRILKSPDVPAWVKAICTAALGYFIFPFDAIFDAVPGLGFTDDITVLAGAIASIGSQWDKA